MEEGVVPIHTIDKCFLESEAPNFGIKKLSDVSKGKGISRNAHRHDFYYLLFIKEGSCIHTIDFNTYEIKPNSIFFISPGQIHATELSKDIEGYSVFFKPDFYLVNNDSKKLLDFPFFHTISNAPVIYMEKDNNTVENTLNEIFTEYHTYDIGRDNIIRALIDILLVRASRKYPKPSEQDFPVHLTYQIRKLESLIDMHFKEHRMLDDYADMMNLSPKHLNSICEKGLNKTVTKLIHERTIIEAKRLLLFTDFTIAQVAYELGYMDKSYFMRFFKKQTSHTPETYRNLNAHTNIV